MQLLSRYFLVFAGVAAGLAFVYQLEISVFWYRAGFENKLSVTTLMMGLVFFVLLVIFCPRENSARGIILQFFAMTHAIPSTVLYIYGVISLKTNLIVLLAFLVLVAASSVRLPTLTVHGLKERHILYGVLAFQGMIVLSIIRLQGFGSFNLDIMKIYDFRREVQDLSLIHI